MEKNKDEIYCPECGKPIKRNAVICVHCGVQVKELSAKNEVKAVRLEPAATSKSKTVSVVLAVFFGFWSWLYTYKKDQLKFWIFFGLWITLFLVLVSYSCSMVASVLEEPYSQVDYDNPLFTLIWLVNVIGWLWALIISIRRPLSFYLNYPYESLGG